MSQIQWDRIAQELGYRDPQHMWNMLYQKHSISQLAMRFSISIGAVRAQLKFHDVKPKPPGGKNHQKVVLTEALVERIKAHGVMTVSRELELDETTLYKALRRAKLTATGHPGRPPMKKRETKEETTEEPLEETQPEPTSEEEES